MKKFFNKTNTLATISLVLGLLTYGLPMFMVLKKDYTDNHMSVVWTFFAVALILYIWPEKVKSAGEKIIDRKADSV